MRAFILLLVGLLIFGMVGCKPLTPEERAARASEREARALERKAKAAERLAETKADKAAEKAAAKADLSKRLIPLYRWYSPSREDNFTTSLPAWAGKPGAKKKSGSVEYRFARIVGMVYSPDKPQPAGTVPLYRWYSPSRKDNFTTSLPAWAGKPGAKKKSGSVEYRFARIVGMVYSPDKPQPAGTVPLYRWYSPSRKDNFTTSLPAWAGKPGAKKKSGSVEYRFARIVGYIHNK